MPRTADDDLFQSSTMTFGEHLEELRVCLIRAAAGLAVGVLLGLFVARPVVHLIEEPLRRALGDYYSERALETFDEWRPRTPAGPPLPYARSEVADAIERHGMTFELREVHPDRLARALGTASPAAASGTAAAFATDALVPVLLWQPLARDPRVSITTHEKKWVWTFLPISIGLFLAGVFLAFFFVFDFVLDYLLQFNAWLGLDPDPRISEWLSFVLLLPIGFGLGFQLPLVMLFLERIGVFDVAAYASQWRMAVLVIVIVSALLTPADPYSMLFLAAPLCLLYFGGIALVRWCGAGDAAAARRLQPATKASQ
jgi:sec-independent protein translocase protein TatC